MQISDDIFLGSAVAPALSGDLNPAPMSQGIGPTGRIYVWDVVPLTLQATGLATAQAVAGAGPLTLTAGTGVVKNTQPSGAFGYVLDVPRCVTLVSSNAGETTQIATISGLDVYGQPMTKAVTLNGTTTVVSSKAFKTVLAITMSAATAGNVSAGFNDRLGLPVCVPDVGYLAAVKYNATLAQDAATFVAADATSPATSATNDVRGLLTPSSAFNGSKRLVVAIMLTGIMCGPNATRAGAFGQPQV